MKSPFFMRASRSARCFDPSPACTYQCTHDAFALSPCTRGRRRQAAGIYTVNETMLADGLELVRVVIRLELFLRGCFFPSAAGVGAGRGSAGVVPCGPRTTGVERSEESRRPECRNRAFVGFRSPWLLAGALRGATDDEPPASDMATLGFPCLTLDPAAPRVGLLARLLPKQS